MAGADAKNMRQRLKALGLVPKRELFDGLPPPIPVRAVTCRCRCDVPNESNICKRESDGAQSIFQTEHDSPNR